MTIPKIPRTLTTIKGEALSRTFWKDIQDGQIVYLYATHEGKEYGCGAFQVLDAMERLLRRAFDPPFRAFLHYPEELYRLDNNPKVRCSL